MINLELIDHKFSGASMIPTKLLSMSDEDIAHDCIRNKKETSCKVLFDRFVDKIYRLAMRITKNPNDAQEVVQDSFLKIVEKYDTFRGESKFSTWVYSIASNNSFNLLRNNKNNMRTMSIDNYTPNSDNGSLSEIIDSGDWASNPDLITNSLETLEIIDKAINELPEKNRMIFHLKDVEGLSIKEVSKIMNASIPSVKTTLHRTRLYLRNILKDYLDESGEIEDEM